MTGLTGSACRSSAFAALAALFSLVWPTLPARADTYVFSTFTGDNAPGEKLSTYQSDDALHFTLVPDGGIGAPSISNTGFGGPSGYLRDPSILKYTDGKYYVTYTDPLSQPCCGEENHFSVASSSDLIHWTNLAMVAATVSSPAGVSGIAHAWAPEWFVDEGVVNIVANIDTLNTDSDFRQYVFTVRAPGHRDRTKRRIPITDFGGCRSRIPGHRDRTNRRIRSPER